jgi:hypothetical protein
MKARTKWMIVAGGSLLGMVLCIFLATPRQPRYQGRALDEWLADLSNPHFETQRVARAAIQAMGPAAVPFLTNSLAQRDSMTIRFYRKNFLPRRLTQWTHKVVKWQTPMMESRNAAIGLQVLGPEGSNAIPALVAALQDPSWTVTQAAAVALGAMGTNAVPTLRDRLKRAKPTEMPWALQAVTALGTNASPLAPQVAEIFGEHDSGLANIASISLIRIGPEAVPVVTNFLSSTNVALQIRTLNLLAQLGGAALVATNEFFTLMQSSNPAVRLSARQALAATIPPRELATPFWLEGLRDSDPTNVEASLRFLTIYPSNVLAYNREIASLAVHSNNSIASMASNALTRFRAWPK